MRRNQHQIIYLNDKTSKVIYENKLSLSELFHRGRFNTNTLKYRSSVTVEGHDANVTNELLTESVDAVGDVVDGNLVSDLARELDFLHAEHEVLDGVVAPSQVLQLNLVDLGNQFIERDLRVSRNHIDNDDGFLGSARVGHRESVRDLTLLGRG